MDLQNFTRHKGLFITGTDTGVGKTLIAGAIARILAGAGKRVGVFKPVATGCRREREGLVSEDAEFLAHCANSEFPLSVINPVGFEIPAAPFVCEDAENKKVDFEQIASAYEYICKESDIIIVEGIGGIRVPVSKGADVLDLAKAFGLPVVVVARPSLGTINHTLLTIEAVRGAGLTLAGVVISGYDEQTADFAIRTNAATISRCGDVRVLAVVPFDEAASVESGVAGRAVLSALQEVDWSRVIGD